MFLFLNFMTTLKINYYQIMPKIQMGKHFKTISSPMTVGLCNSLDIQHVLRSDYEECQFWHSDFV